MGGFVRVVTEELPEWVGARAAILIRSTVVFSVFGWLFTHDLVQSAMVGLICTLLGIAFIRLAPPMR